MDRLIDELCDQLELGWQNGNRPAIESLLADTPAASQDVLLFELVRLENALRQAAGETPELSDYLRRFPNNASVIQAALNHGSSASRSTGRKSDPLDVTATHSSDLLLKSLAVVPTTIASKDSPGEMIGRYRIKRLLGEGAFGSVWLGFDEELQRGVAIKVPKPERFRSPEDAEAYLTEARTVASLDHPHIVPVYDVGRTDEGLIYVVSKYIEGGTLADRMSDGRLPLDEITKVLVTSAQAVHHAHQRHLVHRDIKPANILVEERTRTHYVADFGLAIREEDHLRSGGQAGTPSYMSPEQARGEGHRLDGRSDVFALGVMMYEMLTGKRPFRGGTPNEIFHNIISVEPRPPRSLENEIPEELERICLKALAKRAADRYATAAEMADDLAQWQQGPATSTQEKTIIPKGLRSFDADDADFFLDLLPGPRDRSGLPASLRFWKTRIEAREPEHTFNVGLIYGPSGCGKSSLVKAGLIPRLSKEVIPLYIEATPDETETRIQRALQKHIPDLPKDNTLAENFAWLRRKTGPKIVLIVDQFEQWLHSHRGETDAQLVAAFRQCDGTQLQVIVMVRDDFAMAAARFMNLLEVPILQGKNFATVDLFDIGHAENVLVKFGRAFGKLPAAPTPPADHEQAFVTAVVGGLADEGQVVSVRLSLFAEMVKTKQWTIQTLIDVGGTDGLGVNFLEETFSSRNANPTHRLHEHAARAVLKSLLPGVTTDIKGHMRSHADLLQASGYESHPADFSALLRILDGELRLISPTDPEGTNDSSRSPSVATRYYQLTHDYMVPALREWLTRKQQETRAGRAELKLAERTILWAAKPENRYLPSLVEWFSIRALTDRKRWTPPQQSLMQRATRVHGSRIALGLAASVLLLVGGLWTKARVDEDQARTSASGLVAALLSAETRDVPRLVAELTPYRQWADPELQAALESTDVKTQLHARIALLPVDASQVQPLQNALLDTTPENVLVLRAVLQARGDKIAEAYWPILQSSTTTSQQRLSAGAALAKFAPNDDRWTKVAGPISNLLVNENPLRLAIWIDAFQSVRTPLIPELGKIFRDQSESVTPTQRELATSLLETYAADDVDELSALIVDADPKQFVALFEKLSSHKDAAREKLLGAFASKPPSESLWTNDNLASYSNSPVPVAAKDLIQAAEGIITEHFAVVQSLDLGRFTPLTETLAKSGYRPVRLRPYNSQGEKYSLNSVVDSQSSLVAAIWHRDGRRWHVALNLTAVELQDQHEKLRIEGFATIDIAGYVGAKEEKPEDLYAAVCVKRQSVFEESQIYVGATDSKHKHTYEQLERKGFKFHQSLNVFLDKNEQHRYSGVQLRRDSLWNGVWDRSTDEFGDILYLDRPGWDVSITHEKSLNVLQLPWEQQIARTNDVKNDHPNSRSLLLRRAAAYYQQSRFTDAIKDLDRLIEQSPMLSDAYQYRAMCFAGMGRTKSARDDLAKLNELLRSPATIAYTTAIIEAYDGEFTKAEQELSDFSEGVTKLGDGHYSLACGYAALAKIAKHADQGRVAGYEEKAIQNLTSAISGGQADIDQLQIEPDFVTIRANDSFQALLQLDQSDCRYAALWNSVPNIESRRLYGMSAREHRLAMQQLVLDGFSPVSISSIITEATQKSVAASVWHRRAVSPDVSIKFAKKKANAAVALSRLGESEKIFAVLRIKDDPESFTQFIHRCRGEGITPAELIKCLRVVDQGRQLLTGESRQVEDRVLCGLLLALGEFTLSDVEESERPAIVDIIAGWFASDPSSAIHGASGWLLRQWNQTDIVTRVDQTPVAYTPSREWFTLAIEVGQQTMYQTYVVIQPGEYVIGSPIDEVGRGSHETRHMVRITRPFAILDREVTRGEFEASGIYERGSMQEKKQGGAAYNYSQHSPTTNHPMSGPSWYDSVQYCRWLSDLAGFSEHEQPYPDPKLLDTAAYPIDRESGFPKNWPVDLAQPGFRLPTDAEWEIAARGGMCSMFGFGADATLIDHYAWCHTNSLRQTHTAKELRPNMLGLFDMHGNLYEWCHDWYAGYPITSTQVDPKGLQSAGGYAGASRVLRGGSWSAGADGCRYAGRHGLTPPTGGPLLGLRLALTPSVSTAVDSGSLELRRGTQ